MTLSGNSYKLVCITDLFATAAREFPMNDPATTDALPTPEQMRNYFAAAKSAQKARRLQEASRAIITGNIAAATCLVETVLVVQHAGWTGDTLRMFILDGVLFGYIALAVLSLRWLKRRRLQSSVYVLNQFEAEAKRVPARQVCAMAMLYFVVMVLVTGVMLWTIDVNRVPQWAIIAVLSVGPLAGVGYFVSRFVMFRFWEDLLFAVAVALAYLPFPFQAWHLAPICLAAFPMVIVGTTCLHFRWVRWQRASALHNEDSVSEVRS